MVLKKGDEEFVIFVNESHISYDMLTFVVYDRQVGKSFYHKQNYLRKLSCSMYIAILCYGTLVIKFFKLL